MISIGDSNTLALDPAVSQGILEDDDQLGLAHLIEHMAFNGTTNFEGHEIINYLESTGMKFGADARMTNYFFQHSAPEEPLLLKIKTISLLQWLQILYS